MVNHILRIYNYYNFNNVFSAEMVWCRDFKLQENLSLYIFRIIAYLLIPRGIYCGLTL